MKTTSQHNKSFTLIELLIVVAIIGILAALIIVSVNSAAAKARDAKRVEDLRNIQKALALYYTANGSYPSTSGGWWGNCPGGGSHPVSGSNGYVPNLAPTYIPSLPLDPRQGINGVTTDTGNCPGGANASFIWACYLYQSNGVDYKIEANCTPESYPANNPFLDPPHPAAEWAIYTPGAANW